MDAPFRRNHCLFVLHPYVASLVSLAHEMADSLILRKFEVEIYFHTTFMGMSRHCIPGAARLEFGHSHLELACRHDFLHKHPVDDAVIAFFEGTEFHLDRFVTGSEMVRICGMSRR